MRRPMRLLGCWEQAFAEEQKQEANALVGAGKHRLAAKRYGKALKMIEFDSSMSDDAKKRSRLLKIGLHSNAALCHLKLGQHRDAASCAAKALELDAYNVKALFRRAQALQQLQEFFEAELFLKKVSGGNPRPKPSAGAQTRNPKPSVGAQTQTLSLLLGPKPETLSLLLGRPTKPSALCCALQQGVEWEQPAEWEGAANEWEQGDGVCSGFKVRPTLSWAHPRDPLLQVLELDAENKEAKRELVALKHKQREQNAKDKAVYGRVFGKLAKAREESPPCAEEESRPCAP